MNTDKKMTLKVQGPQSDLRRWNVSKDITYDTLIERVKTAFNLGAPFLIKYKDSDGDNVSITNEEEWRDAIEVEGNLLRLTIHERKAAAAVNQARGRASDVFLDIDVDGLLSSIRGNPNLLGMARTMIPGLDLSHMEAFANELRAQLPELAPTIEAALPAVREALHDAKEMIEGGFQPCRPSQPSQQGQETTETKEKPEHHGVVCDGCNASPITGSRFKCTSLPDYDLCGACHTKWQAEPNGSFAQLNAESTWNEIEHPAPHPADFLRGWKGAGAGHPFGGLFGGKGKGGWKGKGFGDWGKGWGKGCGMKGGKGGRGCGGEGSSSFEGMMEGMMEGMKGGKGWGKGQRDMRFVNDETLFDGMEVSPGQTLTKIWKVRNTGDVAYPEGIHLVSNGGDDLSMQARSPPLLAPEEEGTVSVDITTPSKPGRYVSYFKMAGPRGRPFGQRLWVDIRVTDPDQSPADSVEEALSNPEPAKSPEQEDEPEKEEQEAPPANPFEAVFGGLQGSPMPQNFEDMLRDPGMQDTIRSFTEQNPQLLQLAEAFIPGVGAMINGAPGPVPVPAAPAPTTPTPIPEPKAEVKVVTPPSESEEEYEIVPEQQGAKAEKGKAKQAENTLERVQMLEMLKEMGFADEEVNRMTLEAVGGDTGDALARTVVRLSNIEDSLRQLDMMGFTDAHKNAALLLEHENSLKAVLEILMGSA